VRVAEVADRARAAEITERVLGAEVTFDSDPHAIATRVPDDGADAVPGLLPDLAAAGISVPEFSLGQPSLDEVFLALTGQPLPADEEQGAERAPAEPGPRERTEASR
jgi:ABC-2 type transport system ATP-binding protein